MKSQLYYDQEGHEGFVQNLKTFTDLFPAVMEELKRQGVESAKKMTYQNLVDGKFTEIFHSFHKAEMMKSDVTKRMKYERYLNLYGYHTTQLEDLQTRFMAQMKRDFKFYEHNHDFYRHCETFKGRNLKLKEHFENAPKKKSYVIFNFITVRGNKITIDVPKSLFTLYATNKKQEGITEKVNQLLDIAEDLGLDHKPIKESLKPYLVDDVNTWGLKHRTGLSSDYRIVKFDYNKILQLQ